jgi:hypothetical protein
MLAEQVGKHPDPMYDLTILRRPDITRKLGDSNEKIRTTEQPSAVKIMGITNE